MEQRRGGMRAIGSHVPQLTGPIIGKHGAGLAQLVGEWAAVVGSATASACWPVKLTFPRGKRVEGTLRVHVAPALAPEIQHREPIIVERINGYFGYRAVARLAIFHGPLPLPDRGAAPAKRALTETEQETLDRRLDEVTDPLVRDALSRLGSAIIGAQ